MFSECLALLRVVFGFLKDICGSFGVGFGVILGLDHFVLLQRCYPLLRFCIRLKTLQMTEDMFKTKYDFGTAFGKRKHAMRRVQYQFAHSNFDQNASRNNTANCSLAWNSVDLGQRYAQPIHQTHTCVCVCNSLYIYNVSSWSR